MLRSILILALGFGIHLSAASSAIAQSQQTDLAGCKTQTSAFLKFERRPVVHEGVEEIRMFIVGSPTQPVQINCDEMQLFADQMEVFDGHIVVATGNVVYVSGGNRIAAQRLQFDTKTRTGTFYQASGQATLANRVDRNLFGTQEPDMYFEGEEIRKIGFNKYQIVHGRFTTCVQPTPRWQLVSGKITLTLEKRAVLTNSVLTVKDVPLMYLPIFYYPVQEDDRATGFLIPTYGVSTAKGHSLSNAFFWAIDRSQDATFLHDWFSKTGQGYGGEYRYELGGGNRGSSRVYILNEHEATYTTNGVTNTTPAGKNFLMTGGLSQAFGRAWHARADVNYTSNMAVRQRYEQNFDLLTSRTRTVGGNVTGNWREYVVSGTTQLTDVFYDNSDLESVTRNGSLPRISFSRGERPIGKSKVYFGVGSEYVTQVYRTKSEDVTQEDKGLTRVDVNPVVRIPFTKWPFFTINSAASYRTTYWTESLDPAQPTVQVKDSIMRRIVDLQARFVGPVFNRIWSTPNSGYAEKFKHVIEPTLTVQRTTAFDEFDHVVKIDPVDQIPTGVTKFVYGVNNRIYAKKNVAREIVSVSINQSYYTDEKAAQYDPGYQGALGTAPSHFSAVRIQTRVSPTSSVQGDFATEWNPDARTFTTFTGSGSYNSALLQVTAGWSQRRFIEGFPPYDNLALANQDLNASTTIRRPGNHLGATYMFSYDFRGDRFRQQRYLAFYNAQCCGISVEYQTYNLGGYSSFIIPQDHRFNVSFTLAGIGTFSNFFGAFGGQGR